MERTLIFKKELELLREKSVSLNIWGKWNEHDQIYEKVGSVIHLPLISQHLIIILQNQLLTVFTFTG